MMEELLLPLQLPFMQYAFATTLAVSVPMALLSCFLVLKGWALIGDAVSHAILPGIVIAYMLGLPLIGGAFVAGMGCALATGYLSEHSRVKRDTVMGVVFSGMFGLGLVLFATVTTDVHLDHILYGNMLGIGENELWLTIGVAAVLAFCIIAVWRDLLLHAFDENHAKAIGLPVRLFHYGTLAAITLAIIATLNSVGLILAIGLLITPGATAFLLTKRFGRMLALATAINLVACFTGIYASFFIDSAPAPTIILVLTILFLLVFAYRQIANARMQRAVISDQK